jgi:hypothetical protein
VPYTLRQRVKRLYSLPLRRTNNMALLLHDFVEHYCLSATSNGCWIHFCSVLYILHPVAPNKGIR